MNRPEVSVIIPAFNAERWLGDAVASVMAQTMENWELLIVNDGSTDDTCAVAHGFADPRIRVFDQANAGVSAARNAGITAARGEHICFLDADDVMLPENLATRLHVLKEYQVDWVFGDLAFCTEDLKPTGEEMDGTDGDVLQTTLLAESTGVPGSGSNILAHRRCFELGVRFDEDLSNSADQDLTLCLAARFTYRHIPQVLQMYRMVPASMSTNVALFQRDHLRLYQKAERSGLLREALFRRRCLANVHWAIGGSWWLLAHRPGRAIPFFLRAICYWPRVVVRPIRKRLTWAKPQVSIADEPVPTSSSSHLQHPPDR
jgi:glycosyltransferase involved in cell wall biosynthesis